MRVKTRRYTIYLWLIFLLPISFILCFSQPSFAASPHVLNIQHWQTNNGVPVYFVEAHQLPILDIRVLFNAGSARDGDKPGVARLANYLLGESTKHFNKQMINDQLDNTGAEFITDLNRDMAMVSLRTLTDATVLNAALKTFVTLLTEATFPEQVVTHLKNQQITDLTTKLKLPATQARQAFFSTIFADHPYGHIIEGDVATLRKIQPHDVEKFYHQYYVAKNASLVIVGDMTRENAVQFSEELSEALPLGETPKSLQIVATKTRQYIYIPAMTTQSTIIIGQAGITPTDADYFPLYLANEILGGKGMNSELFNTVRTQKGLVYSINSELYPLQARGTFLVHLRTRNTQVESAIALTQQVLNNMNQQQISDTTLSEVKQRIHQGYLLKFSSNNAIAAQLVYMAFYHLPLNYFDTYLAHIDAVTPQAIHAAWQRHIQPENLVTVVVGKQ